jgi:hypothetical protein
VTVWLGQYQEVFFWLGIISVLTFIVSLFSLPWLVARIPEDYFLYSKRHPANLKKSHPLTRLILLAGKNILGAILIAGGIIMLFIPGQGLLTVAMGLLLMDYPGKYQFERRMVQNENVLHGLNWLRARAKTQPLRVEGEH